MNFAFHYHSLNLRKPNGQAVLPDPANFVRDAIFCSLYIEPMFLKFIIIIMKILELYLFNGSHLIFHCMINSQAPDRTYTSIAYGP